MNRKPVYGRTNLIYDQIDRHTSKLRSFTKHNAMTVCVVPESCDRSVDIEFGCCCQPLRTTRTNSVPVRATKFAIANREVINYKTFIFSRRHVQKRGNWSLCNGSDHFYTFIIRHGFRAASAFVLIVSRASLGAGFKGGWW